MVSENPPRPIIQSEISFHGILFPNKFVRFRMVSSLNERICIINGTSLTTEFFQCFFLCLELNQQERERMTLLQWFTVESFCVRFCLCSCLGLFDRRLSFETDSLEVRLQRQAADPGDHLSALNTN